MNFKNYFILSLFLFFKFTNSQIRLENYSQKEATAELLDESNHNLYIQILKEKQKDPRSRNFSLLNREREVKKIGVKHIKPNGGSETFSEQNLPDQFWIIITGHNPNVIYEKKIIGSKKITYKIFYNSIQNY